MTKTKLKNAIRKSENVAIIKSAKTEDEALWGVNPFLIPIKTRTNSPVIVPVGKNFPEAWEIQVIIKDHLWFNLWLPINVYQAKESKNNVGIWAKITNNSWTFFSLIKYKDSGPAKIL